MSQNGRLDWDLSEKLPVILKIGLIFYKRNKFFNVFGYCVFFFLFHSVSPIELYAEIFYVRSVFCPKCHLLDKKLEYAEYSKYAVSIYLGCCPGVCQITLKV